MVLIIVYLWETLGLPPQSLPGDFIPIPLHRFAAA